MVLVPVIERNANLVEQNNSYANLGDMETLKWIDFLMSIHLLAKFLKYYKKLDQMHRFNIKITKKI